MPRQPKITLFPYTTLFRSVCGRGRAAQAAENARSRLLNVRHRHLTFTVPPELRGLLFWNRKLLGVVAKRSEEHTSELQSLTNLVCRLLLEKKKKQELHTFP